MSLSHKADLYEGSIPERFFFRLDRLDHGRTFILALAGMVLALVVASAIFRPAPVGTGIEITSVGP